MEGPHTKKIDVDFGAKRVSVQYDPDKVAPQKLLGTLTQKRKYAKSSVVATGAVAGTEAAQLRATVALDGKGKEQRGTLRVHLAPRSGKALAGKQPELELGDAGGRVQWTGKEAGWNGKWPYEVTRSFTLKPGKADPKPLEVTVTYYEEQGGEPVARKVTLPVHLVTPK